MLKKFIQTSILTTLSVGALAQPTSIAGMNGKCKDNSQLTQLTAEQLASKTKAYQIFQCNAALIQEMTNGRVVVHFSQKGVANSPTIGFAGYYAGPPGRTNTYIEVDAMYLTGPKFDAERQEAKGKCEIEYNSRNAVTDLSCLSGIRRQGGGIIVSSAFFKPTDYNIDFLKKPAPAATPQPSREPWYGVSASGGKCVPTDMSPAERIEWLRERGVKYDAIDYAGPSVNGRVPKVTIIPKTGNYPNWVYYGSLSFCQEKEVSIEKYR